MDQSHRPFVGARLKLEQNSVWTCPPKLTLGKIEHETFIHQEYKLLTFSYSAK